MTLPRKPQAVVFDMDGLLCDTEAVYRDVMTAVAGDLGHPMPFSLFQRLIGLPGPVSDGILHAHYGEAFPIVEFRERVRDQVGAACEAGVALKAGVGELLDHLDALRLPRAIATSSSHRAVEAHLGASGIIPRFDAVIANGDYAHGKPAPDPYLVAATRLGVAPEFCLALEDSHNGVRSASSAGMMTVMVPDLLDATEEMRGLAVRIARDLHEVVGLLSS